ncbi:uncharacterized protein LOC123227750 [Mangifera indica]|uniref:uncharacterized protein LOC123227750 n=1 Tax=Mangifera indica TaxID=29780 RepID=UPI001CFB2D29|nr:uncharacterized protein LOC123227750 [Mangifera indica]
MRSRANKQSKFMLIISAPIRFLSRARDFYIKGMQDFNGRIGNYDGVVVCPAAQVVHLSKNFSVNSSKPIDDEEIRELLRTASRKNMESKMKLNQSGGMRRSYTVGAGKMGRIEEEEPCTFEEDGSKGEVLYPRSRSYAVNRKNFIHH